MAGSELLGHLPGEPVRPQLLTRTSAAVAEVGARNSVANLPDACGGSVHVSSTLFGCEWGGCIGCEPGSGPGFRFGLGLIAVGGENGKVVAKDPNAVK